MSGELKRPTWRALADQIGRRIEQGESAPGEVGEPVIGYRYKKMAEELAARIERGELPPNTRLPAEVDLAREHGVSLGTARHATQLLRDLGLVVTIRSKGTYIAARPFGHPTLDRARAGVAGSPPAPHPQAVPGTGMAL